MKGMMVLSFSLIGFCTNLHAEKVDPKHAEIIGKYGCYKKKTYKEQHECYVKMYADHPEMADPNKGNYFAKKYNKEHGAQIEMQRKKDNEKKCSEANKVMHKGQCIEQSEYAKSYTFRQQQLMQDGCDCQGYFPEPLWSEEKKIAEVNEKCRQQFIGENIAEANIQARKSFANTLMDCPETKKKSLAIEARKYRDQTYKKTVDPLIFACRVEFCDSIDTGQCPNSINLCKSSSKSLEKISSECHDEDVRNNDGHLNPAQKGEDVGPKESPAPVKGDDKSV